VNSLFEIIKKSDPAEATKCIVEQMKQTIIEDESINDNTKRRILFLYMNYKFKHKQLLEDRAERYNLIKRTYLQLLKMIS